MADKRSVIFGVDETNKTIKGHVLALEQLTVQELNSELDKGYADILNGRTKPASVAFDEIQGGDESHG